MNVTLNTQEEVRKLVNILLNQVLDKENYDMKVHVKICFVECEEDEPGYDMGSCTFIPWGADAFNVMQEFFENTVSPDYINLIVDVENIQEPIQETAEINKQVTQVTEENVRKLFNETFTNLDTARTAGSMYVGDNGAFLLDYLDVTEGEKAGLVARWTQEFGPNSFVTVQYNGNCLQIHIS